MKVICSHVPRVLLSVCLASLFGPAAAGLDSDSSGSAFPDTTLAGIYELALEDDLTIAEAHAQYRVGREERRLALAGLLPQVNASYFTADTESTSRGSFAAGEFIIPNATLTKADTESWEVSLQQPLFDLPAWFRFKQGVELSNQAKAVLAVAQQDLLLRTVTAYFEVLRATANLRASKSQESALKAQLNQIKQRFDVGLVAITDVLEAEAGHDLSVAQRIGDEGALDITRELLSVLTGRQHGELWPLKENFPVRRSDPESPQQWVSFAHENSLDIKVARYSRDAAQNAMLFAKSQHLPRIVLAVSRSDSANDIDQFNLITGLLSSFPADTVRDTISINLSVPLFTGGATSAFRRQAAARHDTQIAFYDGTIRRVTQETRALFTRVSSNVSQSRARARAVISTESALEAAKIGYQVGTRNVVDVLNAQQSYFSAIRDNDNSILDYVVSVVQLKRLVGTLSPQDIYELNEWLNSPEVEETELSPGVESEN